jgi:UDPglucose--hexose-1-phosphate uridylyltransferase
LLRAQSVKGTCRVLCFSPRHDLTLAHMQVSEILTVVDTWAEQYAELSEQYLWVQIFENKGAIMGCSNPHPHGQIWASNALPQLPSKEDQQQLRYYQEHHKPLLLDYLSLELEKQERIIIENDYWVVVVPYWAVWPFETLLLPRFPVGRLPQLNPDQRLALAQILKRLLIRYDNLFETSFPYSMGWHNAPNHNNTHKTSTEHWQLHAHFTPRCSARLQ